MNLISHRIKAESQKFIRNVIKKTIFDGIFIFVIQALMSNYPRNFRRLIKRSLAFGRFIHIGHILVECGYLTVDVYFN